MNSSPLASPRPETKAKISSLSSITENLRLKSIHDKGFGLDDIDSKYRPDIVHPGKVSSINQSIVQSIVHIEILAEKGSQKLMDDMDDVDDILKPLSGQTNFEDLRANAGGTA